MDGAGLFEVRGGRIITTARRIDADVKQRGGRGKLKFRDLVGCLAICWAAFLFGNVENSPFVVYNDYCKILRTNRSFKLKVLNFYGGAGIGKSTREFLLGLGIDMDEILRKSDTLDRLETLREAYNTIVDKDEQKEKFNVIVNTLVNLYESSKPEIFKYDWPHKEEYAVLCYLHGLFHNLIDDEKITRARLKMSALLDNSVQAAKPGQEIKEDFAIYKNKVIDLSKIDGEKLKAEFKQAKYRAVEIDDMKAFIEKALRQMLRRNCTRRKFSERHLSIIDQYNAGSADNEHYYEELVKLLQSMQEEETRASREGLTASYCKTFLTIVK